MERERDVKQLETEQMAAAKGMLGCSTTTNNTGLETEMRMYASETET